jgi:hypothetical protein
MRIYGRLNLPCNSLIAFYTQRPRMNHKQARSLYFVNGPVDFAVIGGISLAIFAVLKIAAMEGRNPQGAWLAAWLAWVVNWPHVSASSYRLYHSRSNINQYPFTAIGVPLLILAGVGASYWGPAAFAPAFVKLFLIWSPYHFSGQSFGVSLIYARRAGITFGRFERAALSGFIYSTFVSSVFRSEDTRATSSYHGIQIPRLGIPEWIGDASLWATYALGGLLLALCALKCVRERRLIPPIILLPPLTQFLWFIPGAGVPSFTEFVPFFHSLQYLLIVWSMQLKERADRSGATPSRAFVFRESVHWGLVNFWGGAALFWILPRAGQLFGHPLDFSEPVIIAAGQIHHFFVDGVIWKLRNPNVASPLLVSLGDLIRQPARAAP